MSLSRIAVGITASFLLTSGATAKTQAVRPKHSESSSAVEAKRIIAARMVDPSSTQFRSVRQTKPFRDDQPVTLVCGEFNSRNRFGGYVGFSSFVYVVDKGEVITGSGDIYEARGTNRLIATDVASVEPYYHLAPPRLRSEKYFRVG